MSLENPNKYIREPQHKNCSADYVCLGQIRGNRCTCNCVYLLSTASIISRLATQVSLGRWIFTSHCGPRAHQNWEFQDLQCRKTHRNSTQLVSARLRARLHFIFSSLKALCICVTVPASFLHVACLAWLVWYQLLAFSNQIHCLYITSRCVFYIHCRLQWFVWHCFSPSVSLFLCLSLSLSLSLSTCITSKYII